MNLLIFCFVDFRLVKNMKIGFVVVLYQGNKLQVIQVMAMLLLGDGDSVFFVDLENFMVQNTRLADAFEFAGTSSGKKMFFHSCMLLLFVLKGGAYVRCRYAVRTYATKLS